MLTNSLNAIEPLYHRIGAYSRWKTLDGANTTGLDRDRRLGRDARSADSRSPTARSRQSMICVPRACNNASLASSAFNFSSLCHESNVPVDARNEVPGLYKHGMLSLGSQVRITRGHRSALLCLTRSCIKPTVLLTTDIHIVTAGVPMRRDNPMASTGAAGSARHSHRRDDNVGSSL